MLPTQFSKSTSCCLDVNPGGVAGGCGKPSSAWGGLSTALIPSTSSCLGVFSNMLFCAIPLMLIRELLDGACTTCDFQRGKRRFSPGDLARCASRCRQRNPGRALICELLL